MALGVTTCTQAIYDAFLSDDRMKTLFHGHSFTANPLACAVAIASMDLLLMPDTQQAIQRIAANHSQFAETIASHPRVARVRQRGTLLAFDLNVGEQTSYFNHVRDYAYRFMLERGVLMRPLGNVLYLMPPYCTTDEQLAYVNDQIIALLDSL
jgi:adenosylmethionine-8-amino-7-oxononanoate aminotransferase